MSNFYIQKREETTQDKAKHRETEGLETALSSGKHPDLWTPEKRDNPYRPPTKDEQQKSDKQN